MADGISCDRCGKGLLVDEPVRYEVNVEVKAAYDPMEITAADLARDLEAEMRTLIRSLEERPAAELEREIYFRGRYDLCGRCQKEFLSDPLFRPPGRDRL